MATAARHTQDATTPPVTGFPVLIFSREGKGLRGNTENTCKLTCHIAASGLLSAGVNPRFNRKSVYEDVPVTEWIVPSRAAALVESKWRLPVCSTVV